MLTSFLPADCVLFLVLFYIQLILCSSAIIVHGADLRNAANSAPCAPEKLLQAQPSYDEYILEHEVTKAKAIEALKQLNDSFFTAPKAPGCKAIQCTGKVMKYCLGSQFLNDHCLCEQGHVKEGLPWVPHTCYVGEKQHTSSVGSCFFFTDVKECCCERALAKRWKSLSSSVKLKENSACIWISLAVMLLGSVFVY